jgi:hypothetical protein
MEMRRNVFLGTIVCWALWLASCTSGGSGQTSAHNPGTLTGDVLGCPHTPSSARHWGMGSSEIEAAATGGRVWALVEGGIPVPAQRDVKIIWRVTGNGTLTLMAVNRAGESLRAEDVAAHDGSSWRRPGDEWGSAWNFPEPGCWDLHVERGTTVADVWLRAA